MTLKPGDRVRYINRTCEGTVQRVGIVGPVIVSFNPWVEGSAPYASVRWDDPKSARSLPVAALVKIEGL